MSFFHDIYEIFQNSMIFLGFPGVPSFFQVFQVEWEPCLYDDISCLAAWSQVPSRGSLSVGGVAVHGDPPVRAGTSWRYAFYWNAFLLVQILFFFFLAKGNSGT